MKYRDSKVLDLVYRFVLWWVVAFILYYLKLAGEAIRHDSYISKALLELPRSELPVIIGFLGMAIGAFAFFLKEFPLLRDGRSETGRYISKASSDLLLVPYHLMAFALGWLSANAVDSKLNEADIVYISSVLFPYFSIMFALAGMSLLVRIQKGDRAYELIYMETVFPIRRTLIFALFSAPLVVMMFFKK